MDRNAEVPGGFSHARERMEQLLNQSFGALATLARSALNPILPISELMPARTQGEVITPLGIRRYNEKIAVLYFIGRSRGSAAKE